MATRQIKIQTGVVKRLTKEVEVYRQELVQQQARIDRFVAEGKDEHDVRKQKEVLEETVRMIPDSQKRLETARIELQYAIASALAKDSSLEDSDDIKAARAALAQ